SQPEPVWNANGAPATRGTCPACGGTIYRTGRTAAHDSLPKLQVTAAKRKLTTRKTKAGATKGKNKSARLRSEKKGARKRTQADLPYTGPRNGKLVVVESPAKAKTIGRYLGKGFRVMSSVGHVRDLLKSRLSVDIENAYTPEYRVPNDKRQVVKELQAAAARADEIYLATDPDREGEAIAWHVRESAEMDPARTHRVVFQEVTRPAVVAAFQQPREIDMDRVNAQQARRILDRLVGYKLSPLLWRKVRGRLSAGRVQSVAVRLVVERQREIDTFATEEYWTLDANLSRPRSRGQEPRPYFQARLHKIGAVDPVLESAESLRPHLAALEQARWDVTDVRSGTRARRPAAPFTTSTLQQESSRRCGFGTSKTMRIAQQLYEGVSAGREGSVGLITYMRTDSLNVAREAQLAARSHIERHFGKAYLPKSPPMYRSRSKGAQEAHEAIRPTSVERTPKKLKPFLSRDQFRIYQLIWERFVASQMAPAVYDTMAVDIMAGPAGMPPAERTYHFRATGSSLRFAGFLALYEETEPSDRPDSGENSIPPDLKAGELLDLLALVPEQHFTQPPPRYSEATLVKALEENGIGRPSTYASIISTILARGYVEYEDKRLAPTEVGRLVNDLLVEHFPEVLSVDFTAKMEDDLDEIAEGSPWVPVVDDFYRQFARRLEAADEAIEKVDLRAEPRYVGRDCPECGNPLVLRQGRYGEFIGCSTFPKCRHTEQILTKIGVACPKDGGELVEKRTRKRRKFYACANYPECDWTSWKKPLPQPCRVCGGLVVQVSGREAECTQCGQRQPIKRGQKVTEPAGER
ncbi:MAG: type I DNA topoisomerase, partial [Geminicoccales bacterium]